MSGGVVISTGSGSVLRGLVTGGVDVPLSEQFTANAGVNYRIFGQNGSGFTAGSRLQLLINRIPPDFFYPQAQVLTDKMK